MSHGPFASPHVSDSHAAGTSDSGSAGTSRDSGTAGTGAIRCGCLTHVVRAT
jgi:hypothetical protein